MVDDAFNGLAAAPGRLGDGSPGPLSGSEPASELVDHHARSLRQTRLAVKALLSSAFGRL